MSDQPGETVGSGPSQRAVEIGVAIVALLFGAIVVVGSIEAGVGWGDEGPRAGFFPFYVGIIIIAASVINLGQIAFGAVKAGAFADWAQIGQVVSVLVPSIIYVAIIPWLGIYVASALLIAEFMKRIGGYGWARTLAIAVGMPIITFIVFERWFLVPLPKGPLEDFLGL